MSVRGVDAHEDEIGDIILVLSVQGGSIDRVVDEQGGLVDFYINGIGVEDVIFIEYDISIVVGFDDEEGVFEGCIDEVEVLAVIEDGRGECFIRIRYYITMYHKTP